MSVGLLKKPIKTINGLNKVHVLNVDSAEDYALELVA